MFDVMYFAGNLSTIPIWNPQNAQNYTSEYPFTKIVRQYTLRGHWHTFPCQNRTKIGRFIKIDVKARIYALKGG